MTADAATTRRIDQWLWFARFAKSRSLAARLCSGGAVSVNGAAVRKANHSVRPGDLVELARGKWRRSVRIIALGEHRGPATEARGLYDEVEAAARVPEPDWELLLEEA